MVLYPVQHMVPRDCVPPSVFSNCLRFFLFSGAQVRDAPQCAIGNLCLIQTGMHETSRGRLLFWPASSYVHDYFNADADESFLFVF